VLPHSVVIDKNDRVYVGDRENARIQIFDADGRFLAQWTGIGYPYGLWITPDQHIWMVDGGFDRIVEFDQTGKILGSSVRRAISQASLLGGTSWRSEPIGLFSWPTS